MVEFYFVHVRNNDFPMYCVIVSELAQWLSERVITTFWKPISRIALTSPTPVDKLHW